MVTHPSQNGWGRFLTTEGRCRLGAQEGNDATIDYPATEVPHWDTYVWRTEPEKGQGGGGGVAQHGGQYVMLTGGAHFTDNEVQTAGQYNMLTGGA